MAHRRLHLLKAVQPTPQHVPERNLVPALVVCGDQLHHKLDTRLLCRAKLVDRRLRFDEVPALSGSRSADRLGAE
jgi:hypothetical protein